MEQDQSKRPGTVERRKSDHHFLEELESASSSESNVPPHLRTAAANVPVTPGIDTDTYQSRRNSPDEVDGLLRPSSGYFAKAQADRSVALATGPVLTGLSPSSLGLQQLSSSARHAQEVLYRIGPANMNKRRESLSEIRADVPHLALSGSVISATFHLPYSMKYRKGQDWRLNSRRGQSALFDSFTYLSSPDAPWNHTVVAWTGEIEASQEMPSPPDTPPRTTVNLTPLNNLSAPIPLNGERPHPTSPLHDGLWLSREDMNRLELQLARDKKVKTVPVWLADDTASSEDGILLKDQARWRRYAEHDLYTLLHYKQHEPADGRKERVQWADYYRMNQKFANRILETYKPGDIVIIHDYYLMLLPSMLRQRVPHMYIAFFLHSPFPSSEFLRCLPRRKEVLEGVLGSNLVGFQSFSYSRHFASCCERILHFPSDTNGVEAYGSRVEVGVFPIGIDAIKVESLAWKDSVTEKYEALKKLYQGKVVIVGRDRLDSVRGVAQKLMAFERFLELYPEWREKAVLVQVTSPTSIEHEKEDEDNKIASRVNALVTKINGSYGSLGFAPVQHYPQYISQDEYFALLRLGDIGLITSVRDGMNTTSLEYVICQREAAGPLILSEFSGTAGQLKQAMHINPWDLSGVAAAINNALTMSHERRYEMEKHLLEHVTTRNVQSWIGSLLRRLVTLLGSRTNTVATPLLDRTGLLKQYRAAKRRLFMFDYDGTLTPIVREPSAAVPSDRVIHILSKLAADHRNAVWIISGRDQEFLQQHLGHIKEMGFSAEHGSFMRYPGSEVWDNLTETFDMNWQHEVLASFEAWTAKIPGSVIERKRCALTWHYRQADPVLGPQGCRQLQKELEATVAQKWDVEVMLGKANLEVRPTFINKGEIAKRLVMTYNADIRAIGEKQGIGIESLGTDNKLEFVLCMGDDFTDEDMFRALNGLSAELVPDHCFTVMVGASSKVTLARWHLLEPEDVIECVELLAGAADRDDPDLRRPNVRSLGDVNLAALSAVEDHIPEGAGKAP